MPKPLLVLLGVLVIVMGLWALVTGKVVAGSKGFKSNYYYKKDDPFLYYAFIGIYLVIGAFVLYSTL